MHCFLIELVHRIRYFSVVVVLEVDITQEASRLHYLHNTTSKQARAGDSPKSEQAHSSAQRYGLRGKDVPFSLRHVTCFFLTIVGWDRTEAYHYA